MLILEVHCYAKIRCICQKENIAYYKPRYACVSVRVSGLDHIVYGCFYGDTGCKCLSPECAYISDLEEVKMPTQILDRPR